MFRKLVTWLLLLPLPVNGLWMVCRDAPQAQVAQPEQASAPTPADQNLFKILVGDADPQPAQTSAKERNTPECEKICSIKSAARGGPVCLLSSGGKASLTIIVFGVAVISPQVQFHPPATAGQFLAEVQDIYLNPSLAHSTPPPKV